MAKATLTKIFVTFFILSVYVIERVQSEQLNDNSIKSLTRCIIEEVKNDFNYNPTVFMNSLKNYNEYENNKVKVVNAILSEVNINNVPLLILNDYALIDNDTHTNILSIILLDQDDCNKLDQINFEEKGTKYLLIYLGELKKCDFKLIGEQIITKDVTIMYKINDKYIFQNAIMEMDDIYCTISDKIKLKEINRCMNGSFAERSSIFPKKSLMNFKKCPLNVGIGELFPYMLLTKGNGSSYQNLNRLEEAEIKGSDVEVLKMISNYFNATINFYYISKEQGNPYASTDFLNFLLNGSLDVCAGGLYRIYGEIFDYSGVYSTQSVVWVYNVERDIRSWESFIRNVHGQYIFLFFYLIHVTIWKLICKLDNNVCSWGKTLLYTWGALLGTTSLLDARTTKQKIVNAMYLILSLHSSAYLSVQLYSYLTIQSAPKLYRTFDELVDSGIKPYLKPKSKYFIRDHKYEIFANTSGDCMSYQHCQEIILEKKGTTVLNDGYMPVFQLKTAVNDEARVIKLNEEIIIISHEMVLRKNSYFGEAFRKTLLRLYEAGICKKLYAESIGVLVWDKANFAAKNVMSNSYGCQSGCAITLSQSAGLFYFWIGGCSLAALVFILELAFARFRRFRELYT